MSKNFKPILVVAGDPKSIFLEIYFKSLKTKKFLNPLILIVNKRILTDQMKLLKYQFKLNELQSQNLELFKLNNDVINYINIPLNSKRNNIYLKESFNLALRLLKKNKKLQLLNGPINKKKFLKGRHLGITEFLASKTKTKKNVVMLIFNKKLSVSPITTHVPLKNIHTLISKKRIINHVKLINNFYKKRFGNKPKIGITGLNPHCESNFESSEEKKIIIPTIYYLAKQKYNISGPFPADTIFLKENRNKYDVIIGMYHDQVLGPIKSIFEFDAINITLGLPFNRVSPDHGPNEKMFGKNRSNPKSLIKAIEFLDN
jgi:4-hydroxythreonine-4-phosphate dehydrogenase